MEDRKADGIGFVAGKWPLDPKEATIVFIHGAGGSSNFWQAQVEGLAERANTVAVDLPGHGRSDGNGCSRIEDYSRAVVNFMRAVKVPRPIPCGISLGGAIVQQLLLDYPDFFEVAILISTGSRLKVAPEIFATVEKDIKSYVNMMADFAASPSTDPDRIKPFKDDAARCKPEVLIQDFQACNRFDIMQRVGAITAPVLVVSAEDDLVTPPKYGDFLETSIATASRVHIMDAGHIVPMEKPEEVNRAIIEFLDLNGL